jgi:hypothetical protein
MSQLDDGPQLDPEERAALARLPRTQDPDPALEDRIVRALVREGLLSAAAPRRTVPLPLALAASLALFVCGVLAGWGVASRDATAERPVTEQAVTTPAADIRLVFWL